MGDGHRHGGGAAAARGGAAAKRRMAVAAALIGGFFVVELAVGLATGSLALLGDAGHMFTDVLGLGMALAAIHAADVSRRRGDRSFGLYRLEILAALANAVLLFVVGVAVLVEAVRRFGNPPEIDGGPVLVAAVLGLVVNLVVLWLLRDHTGGSLNVEAASLEVLADTLGSVGAIVTAVVLQTTSFTLIDPIFGVVIGIFVLPRTVRIAGRALRVLIQAAPPDVDLARVESDLAGLRGVDGVHDLHVWTLTSGMEVASVHLRLRSGADTHDVLDRANSVLRTEHDIEHATVQLEPAEHAGCDDCETMHW